MESVNLPDVMKPGCLEPHRLPQCKAANGPVTVLSYFHFLSVSFLPDGLTFMENPAKFIDVYKKIKTGSCASQKLTIKNAVTQL